MKIRLAARRLLKAPAFSITVILTLALGIGANTAVFSAIDAVLLRPLPFPAADQLMLLEEHNPRNGDSFVAPPRLRDWNRMSTSFSGLTGYYTQDSSELSGSLPERLKIALVAPRFLEVLGASPALGRDFTPEEGRFGGPNAILISDRYWRRRFDADPHAPGTPLRLGQTSYTIVGVMPASFLFQDRDVDAWLPVFMDAPYAQSRQATWFTVIGRLKPGMTIEEARADIATVQTALGRDFGPPDSDLTVTIQPLKEIAISGVRQSLWVLFGAVSLLLLIACINIAALLLARASKHEQQVALQFALGASRVSVVLDLMAEAFLLSTAGAAFGFALAFGAARVFRMLSTGLPRADEIRIDGGILLYALGCIIASTVLCGLIPAFRSSRRNVQSSLAQLSRAQVSGRNAMQWTLAGVQIALAVTLLSGAGLLLRSLQALGRVSSGFDTTNVLTLRITGSWSESNMRQRGQRTVEVLETIPGIERAATAISFPGVPGEYASEFTLVGGSAGTDSKIKSESRYVSPGYFTVMRIPLLAGEMCRDEATPGVVPAMVNRSFANTYFPGSDAVGHMVLSPNSPVAPPIRIRGIVADAREMGITRPPVPVLYTCAAFAQPNSYFMVRTRTDARALGQTIRRQLRDLEPNRSVYDIVPLEDRLTDAFAQNRLRTVLLAFFALTAVSLASVGLYGTLSYSVNLRRREVGLRLALGAMRTSIVRRFLARGLCAGIIGCMAGLALGAGFNRVLAGILFGVSASDPPTWAAVIAIMLAVAACASLVPSVRASRIDPMQTLRDE
jgi:putative ABC transport system permease protein